MSATYSIDHYTEYQQTKKKNIFEEVVDQMMLDGISPSLQEKISNLPLEDKRMAILAFLDRDRNLFLKIKSLISRENLSKMDYVKDVVRMLREYVKVGEVEKKKFGEVMTSLDLVKEMIATLPEDVWSNPDLKWLDPANGTGPFPIMVIYRLMIGLEKWQPDVNLRYKHVVENMIYTCELQAKNVFLWLCAVDPHDEYETNTYWGSFLEDGFDKHMKEVWGVEKFDVILGNPPYQEMDGGGNGSSSKPLYNIFTKMSIEISNIVLFITPSRWFAGGKGLDSFRKMMINSNKIRLISHFDDASKIFGNSVSISGGVSYFLWDSNYVGLCEFNGNSIDLSKNDVLISNNTTNLIIDKISSHGLKSFEDIVLPRNPYLVKSKNWQEFGIDIITKDGHKKIKESDFSDRFGILGRYKCLISKANGNAFFKKRYITDYKISPPNSISSETYLVCGSFETINEVENVGEYLLTKFARFLLSLRMSGQNNSKDKFYFIPQVDFSKKWTDKDLYEYFNLTEEEINLIETAIK